MNTQQLWKPDRPVIALRIAGPSPEPFIFAAPDVRAHILNQAGLMWGGWVVAELNNSVEVTGHIYGPLNQCCGVLFTSDSDLKPALCKLRELLSTVSLLPFSQIGFWDEREGFFRTWHPTTGVMEDLNFYISAERMNQATREIQELSNFLAKHGLGGKSGNPT